MSAKMKKTFSREMQNLDAAGLLRTETTVIQTSNMEAHLGDDINCLNFMGNDFLGWSSNNIISETAKKALSDYGTGSTSSRISIGTLDIVKTLEEKLSDFLGTDESIVFPSIYLANIGLFAPLTSQRDAIFIDEMCNPGLFDGARLSNANVITYKHKDYDNLEYHLKCSQNYRFRIVVTDGIFNTDGSCPNFNHILKLREVYDAISVVDDSLGIGILGENGKGTFSHLHLEDKAELVTGSFAFGLGNVNGGFICGDKDLVNWIRRTSRSYILSEPLSPINAAIVLKVIKILEEEPSVLEKLKSNSKYIKQEILNKNWTLISNDFPFVSINVGSTLNAQKMVEYLFEENILVSGLCYPNTPEGASLLRINISANHTEEQINKLIECIEKAFKLLE